jgi:hypothetical protein
MQTSNCRRHLLWPPSTPDEARQVAIERAEAGQEITTAVAKEILAETRKKKRPKRQKAGAHRQAGPASDERVGAVQGALEAR